MPVSSLEGLSVGAVLDGRYEILERIGEGGMGTVWRARSVVLDVELAIKVVRSEHADDLASQRLLREAQVTAALGHPSIVRAFDFGTTGAGEPFLVMELLHGISLATWLEREGRMPALHAVQMLLPVIDGLQAAHSAGVVHRDVKPANIIVVSEREGTCQPKLVDFGIAKVEKRRGQVLTEEGTLLGSLEYMAPEQANGKEVDEHADMWSVCVVLYELVTGRRPFGGNTLVATLMALYSQAPVPITDLAVGDPELWAIIARGLAKSPDERWSTMRELGQALAAWATSRGVMTDVTGASLEHVWLGRASSDFSPKRVITSSERSTPAPVPSPRAVSVYPGTMRAAMGSAPTLHNSSPSVDDLASPSFADRSSMNHGLTGASTSPPTLVTPTRSRNKKARFASLVAMLVVAPVLGVAGVRAHGASPVSDAALVAPIVAPPSPTSEVAPTVSVVPTATATEAVTAIETASAVQSAEPPKAPAPLPAKPRSLPGTRSKSGLVPMPLPSQPGF